MVDFVVDFYREDRGTATYTVYGTQVLTWLQEEKIAYELTKWKHFDTKRFVVVTITLLAVADTDAVMLRFKYSHLNTIKDFVENGYDVANVERIVFEYD